MLRLYAALADLRIEKFTVPGFHMDLHIVKLRLSGIDISIITMQFKITQ